MRCHGLCERRVCGVSLKWYGVLYIWKGAQVRKRELDIVEQLKDHRGGSTVELWSGKYGRYCPAEMQSAANSTVGTCVDYCEGWLSYLKFCWGDALAFRARLCKKVETRGRELPVLTMAEPLSPGKSYTGLNRLDPLCQGRLCRLK